MKIADIARSTATQLTKAHIKTGATQWTFRLLEHGKREFRLYVHKIANGCGECYVRVAGERIAVPDDTVSVLWSVQVTP